MIRRVREELSENVLDGVPDMPGGRVLKLDEPVKLAVVEPGEVTRPLVVNRLEVSRQRTELNALGKGWARKRRTAFDARRARPAVRTRDAP